MISLKLFILLTQLIEIFVLYGQIIHVNYLTNILVLFIVKLNLMLARSFVEKIKQIEFKFRGEYLQQCRGRGKQKETSKKSTRKHDTPTSRNADHLCQIN